MGTAGVLALLLLTGQTVLDQQLEPWGNEQIRGQMHAIHQVQNGAP